MWYMLLYYFYFFDDDDDDDDEKKENFLSSSCMIWLICMHTYSIVPITTYVLMNMYVYDDEHGPPHTTQDQRYWGLQRSTRKRGGFQHST